MISTGAGLRALRAVVFAATVLLLAAGAHVVAGGSLPGLPILLAVGVPVACAAVVLARRTRGLPSLVAALAVGQLVLHETFMTTSGVACAPAHAGSGAGHHHQAAVTCDAMPSMAAASHVPSLLMLTLHAVAVLATALLLAHGERLATRLATWARGLLARTPVLSLPALPQRALFVRTAAPCTPLRSATDVSRRGPPVRPALVPITA